MSAFSAVVCGMNMSQQGFQITALLCDCRFFDSLMVLVLVMFQAR